MADIEPSFELPDNPSREQVQEFFKGDLFAYSQAGARVLEARRGHGVAEMELKVGMHYNAEGNVMGGAIFTLADYAFAAASVPGHGAAVALTSTIEFMKASKGTKLIATCDIDKSGNRIEFYTTFVEDDLGEPIAKIVSTCYHPSRKVPAAPEGKE